MLLQEVVRYARYLGMRPIQDRDLLWIAECALTAPVPGEAHSQGVVMLCTSH